MKLVEPYFETGRDVCADNLFTHIILRNFCWRKSSLYLVLLGGKDVMCQGLW